MTARKSLGDYIAENASLPPDVILGDLVWFEVADGSYEGDTIAESFDRHGLNPSFLPPRINPLDAYKKASSGVAGLKYGVALSRPDVKDGQAEILVRDVQSGKDQMVRHLVREIRDEGHRRLAYDVVGELVYFRPKVDANNRVDHKSARIRASLNATVSPEERKILTELCQEFTRDYDRYARFHDGQKMRGVLRSYLLYLNGVLMKSSVYFVHQNRIDELNKLVAFCAEFPGLQMDLWQIPDIGHHREKVVEAFQREAEKELATLLAKIQNHRETRKNVTDEMFVKLKKEYDEVQKRAAEHQRTLSITQSRTSSASEMVMEALVRLRKDVLSAEAEQKKAS